LILWTHLEGRAFDEWFLGRRRADFSAADSMVRLCQSPPKFHVVMSRYSSRFEASQLDIFRWRLLPEWQGADRARHVRPRDAQVVALISEDDDCAVGSVTPSKICAITPRSSCSGTRKLRGPTDSSSSVPRCSTAFHPGAPLLSVRRTMVPNGPAPGVDVCCDLPTRSGRCFRHFRLWQDSDASVLGAG